MKLPLGTVTHICTEPAGMGMTLSEPEQVTFYLFFLQELVCFPDYM